MSSHPDVVQHIVDHIQHDGEVSYKKMFGEYAIYWKHKVVALVCDDKLFVKPTEAGRTYIKNVVEAAAYPGAKPSFLITDEFEDGDWFTKLIQLTFEALPEPKPKRKHTQHTHTSYDHI